MFKKIKSHLLNNTGDAYIEKLILIAMAFVIGGLLLAALSGALNGNFGDSVGNVVENIFNW